MLLPKYQYHRPALGGPVGVAGGTSRANKVRSAHKRNRGESYGRRAPSSMQPRGPDQTSPLLLGRSVARASRRIRIRACQPAHANVVLGCFRHKHLVLITFLFSVCSLRKQGLALEFWDEEPVGSAHRNAEAWQSEIQAETPTCARINNPKTVRFPNGPFLLLKRITALRDIQASPKCNLRRLTRMRSFSV